MHYHIGSVCRIWTAECRLVHIKFNMLHFICLLGCIKHFRITSFLVHIHTPSVSLITFLINKSEWQRAVKVLNAAIVYRHPDSIWQIATNPFNLSCVSVSRSPCECVYGTQWTFEFIQSIKIEHQSFKREIYAWYENDLHSQGKQYADVWKVNQSIRLMIPDFT